MGKSKCDLLDKVTVLAPFFVMLIEFVAHRLLFLLSVQNSQQFR